MNLTATSRDARGLFLPGARPGPGRPRREPRSPAARALLEDLRDTANRFLERRPDAGIQDVLEAADALVLRAREVRRKEGGPR